MQGGPKAIKMLLNDLPTIYEKKNPVLAALLGFFFGGIGLGLYFMSWKDFLYPMLVVLLLIITFASIIPVIGIVPGIFLGGLFSAGWGAWRASGSKGFD